MTTLITVVVVLLVVAVVAAVVVAQSRKRDRAQLQDRFGPEYERKVGEADNRRDAERELSEQAAKRDQLDVRDLSAQEREEYSHEWQTVQALFVDEPGRAVEQADSLVARVMEVRGYPVGDYDQRAEMAAVDHPEVVEHYRAAHALHDEVARDGQSEGTTEKLREAFVHYRALFEALLGHESTPNR